MEAFPNQTAYAPGEYSDTVSYSSGKHEVVMGFGLFHQRQPIFQWPMTGRRLQLLEQILG